MDHVFEAAVPPAEKLRSKNSQSASSLFLDVATFLSFTFTDFRLSTDRGKVLKKSATMRIFAVQGKSRLSKNAFLGIKGSSFPKTPLWFSVGRRGVGGTWACYA